MGDDMIFTGIDAIKSVCNEKGAWNWCLIGADPENLPLAGGGSGFIDEMRECLSTSGNSVIAGMIRCSFKKIQGGELTVKWVIVFATLDGQESSMSAVQRGKALAKRPMMEKAFGQYCKVITDTFEITSADELSTEEVLARVKKSAIIDGELEIPKYDPEPPMIPMTSMVPEAAGEVVEEYEPEMDASPENKQAARESQSDMAAIAAAAAAEAENDEARMVPMATEVAEAAAPEQTSTPAAEPEETKGYPATDPLTAAAQEKKEEEKTKAADAPVADVASALGRFNKGDLVDIWSHTENKWFTDGVIEEVREKSSTTADGKPLPAGCAKIVYNNGQRGKWLQPEVLNDRSVVKPSIKPPHFQGFMKKETHNILSEWHIRYFELRDGFLTWWITLEDSKAGVKPQCCLELVGLQMKAADKSTKISIRTASSRGVVYNFDINAGQNRTIEEWVTALKQHAAFANRMYKFRTAGGMKAGSK